MMLTQHDLNRFVAAIIVRGPCPKGEEKRQYLNEQHLNVPPHGWEHLKICVHCESVQCMMCESVSCQCWNDE